MSRWTWLVENLPAPERIDKEIAKALEKELRAFSDSEPPKITRTRIQNLLEEGKVRVDGKIASSKTRLAQGMCVEIELPPPESMELVPEDRPLEILFQDEHLLVVNKPPGLTVHPSATQKESTLVHALLFHIKDLSGIGGVLRPGIVHRLDKDTSGALVITKSDAAHVAMTEIFSKHDLERRYWALCYGVPKLEGKAQMTVRSTLGRNPNDRVRMAMNVKGGKEAITHVRLMEEYGHRGKNFASFVEATLETGRTHQVRVHLTGLGASLLGDPLYGTPTQQAAKWKALPPEVQVAVSALPGQALHARILAFRHPITGQDLRFEANPPVAFEALQKALAPFS
jgi:23S rRNA pseudouridine1911/1915/1917 synthase